MKSSRITIIAIICSVFIYPAMSSMAWSTIKTVTATTKGKAIAAKFGRDIDKAIFGQFDVTVKGTFNGVPQPAAPLNRFSGNKSTGGFVLVAGTDSGTKAGVIAGVVPAGVDSVNAIVSYSGKRRFNGILDYNVSFNARAHGRNPGSVVVAKSTYRDPIDFLLEDATTGITFGYSLLTGTQIQNVGDGLELVSRYALGNYGSNLDGLWADSSTDFMDYYHLSIKDVNGNLSVALNLQSGLIDINNDAINDFNIVFDSLVGNTQDIKAKWTLSGDMWTLTEDLDLFNATIGFAGTNNFDFSSNLQTAAGVSLSNSATAAIPVPPALYLFGSGLVGLAGVARRRRSSNYSDNVVS